MLESPGILNSGKRDCKNDVFLGSTAYLIVTTNYLVCKLSFKRYRKYSLICKWEINIKLLCSVESLRNLIRSWKSPGILCLHGSMNPVFTCVIIMIIMIIVILLFFIDEEMNYLEEEEEDTGPMYDDSGKKIGAKKQRKLEEKEAKRQAREVSSHRTFY